MIKEFFMKKMIEAKMKDVPPEDREKFVGMIQKNPELFKKISEQVQEKMKSGKDQFSATMEVVKNFEAELKQLM